MYLVLLSYLFYVGLGPTHNGVHWAAHVRLESEFTAVRFIRKNPAKYKSHVAHNIVPIFMCSYASKHGHHDGHTALLKFEGVLSRVSKKQAWEELVGLELNGAYEQIWRHMVVHKWPILPKLSFRLFKTCWDELLPAEDELLPARHASVCPQVSQFCIVWDRVLYDIHLVEPQQWPLTHTGLGFDTNLEYKPHLICNRSVNDKTDRERGACHISMTYNLGRSSWNVKRELRSSFKQTYGMT